MRLQAPVESLKRIGKGRYSGLLKGPVQQKGSQFQEATLEFQLDVIDDQSARFSIGKQTLTLDQRKMESDHRNCFQAWFSGELACHHTGGDEPGRSGARSLLFASPNPPSAFTLALCYSARICPANLEFMRFILRVSVGLKTPPVWRRNGSRTINFSSCVILSSVLAEISSCIT